MVDLYLTTQSAVKSERADNRPISDEQVNNGSFLDMISSRNLQTFPHPLTTNTPLPAVKNREFQPNKFTIIFSGAGLYFEYRTSFMGVLIQILPVTNIV